MTTTRKDQHLDIVLSGAARPQPTGPGSVAGTGTGLDAVVFEHQALPELALSQIDLSTRFLGKAIALPLMIGAMTGGPSRAAAINATLAEVCEAFSIPLAVGSQRIAIEGLSNSGLDIELRRIAPTIPILAKFGAAQLNRGFGRDEALRAVEMIGADALILHLNPLQEALQPEGDRDWRGLAGRIGALAGTLPVPVVVKEVGFGLSTRVIERLAEEGIAIFDVAGRGGTDWSIVEARRATGPVEAGIADAFAGWGIPTATAITQARACVPDATLIGSGGIMNGIDVARALRLGADICSLAGGIIGSAVEGPQALAEQITIIAGQLRTVCFCTASRDLVCLKSAPLLTR